MVSSSGSVLFDVGLILLLVPFKFHACSIPLIKSAREARRLQPHVVRSVVYSKLFRKANREDGAG